MRVLLAIDDSKFSQAATQALIERSVPKDTEVRVLYVLTPIKRLMGEMETQIGDASALEHAQLMQAKTLVEEAAQRLRAARLNVTTVVEEGDPKTRIIDYAAQWHADLIVLGSHGRRGIDRFLLGSVSEAVARHAPCSVEIVRFPRRPREQSKPRSRSLRLGGELRPGTLAWPGFASWPMLMPVSSASRKSPLQTVRENSRPET
jgi:nucleotide-binding universal stress UspA family protein